MPRIRFTADPKPTSRRAEDPDFKAGQEHDLSVDQCERWIRRGVAEYVPEAGAAPPREEKRVEQAKPAGEPSIKHIGGGKYHVLAGDGSRITDKPVGKAEAEAALEKLKAPAEKTQEAPAA